jgi:hypothetical protein
MLDLLCFILLYLIPAVISYFCIRNKYKNNKYFLPNIEDILFVIVPFVNIGVIISHIISIISDSDDIGKKISRKFFRL